MNQPAIKHTFHCQRYRCKLLPKRCIQRQRSLNPEIYEACLGCKQGLELVRKNIKLKASRPNVMRRIKLYHLDMP